MTRTSDSRHSPEASDFVVRVMFCDTTVVRMIESVKCLHQSCLCPNYERRPPSKSFAQSNRKWGKVGAWLLHMFSYAAKFQQQNPQYLFWQKTSHPTELYNATVFQQKEGYIHQNPVKAGYVSEAHHWYYSSAHPLSPLSMEVE